MQRWMATAVSDQVACTGVMRTTKADRMLLRTPFHFFHTHIYFHLFIYMHIYMKNFLPRMTPYF